METLILTQLTVNQVRDLLRTELDAYFSQQPNIQKVQKESENTWFDLNELCTYLPDKPAKPTVYAWVNQGIIPYHKGGKKLRFLKSEIDEWLRQGKQVTKSETNKGMDQFLRTHKKKSGGPKL
jgi:excisionase family DNA binding protein